MSPNTRQSTHHDRLIAERIKAARLAAGWSQEKLGAVLGITFQQVQKYEGGANRISAGRVYEIANALGVSVASFFPTENEAPRMPMLKFSRADLAMLHQWRRLPPPVRRSMSALVDDVADSEPEA